MIHSILIGVLCGTSPAAAAAETAEDAPLIERSQAGLTFTFVPGIWLARFGGKATLGPEPPAERIELTTQLDLDEHLELTPNFELTVRKDDRWQLKFGGFDFSTSGDGIFPATTIFGPLTLEPGDTYEATLDFTSANAELSWWGWSGVEAANGVTARAAPTFGVRYLEIGQSIETADGRADAEGQWTALYAGADIEVRWPCPDRVPLLRALEITGGLAAGPAFGGDGGFMWQLHAGVHAMFSNNFGATFGYRLVNFDVEDGDYQVSGGLQGLFLGAVITF